jgi:hypothetical protein
MDTDLFETMDVSGTIGHPNFETASVFALLDSDLATLIKVSSDIFPGSYGASVSFPAVWYTWRRSGSHSITFYALSDLGEFAVSTPRVSISLNRNGSASVMIGDPGADPIDERYESGDEGRESGDERLESGDQESGLPMALIIGIVVGAMVVIVLIVVGGVYI